jgi:predicted DNA-binding ribbon-helix-helix protein
MMPSPVVKHSVYVAGHNTSVSVEDVFWSHLKAIAAHQNKSLAKLVTEIDTGRNHHNLSSAARLYVLNFVKQEIDHGKVLSF